ncbi:hypothetical protein CBR_g23712 [Chara braunii]|uniref:Uncharacterized protein n=1 Tax=Chara braunii TaxID=69332 RepID=A0A388L501_CHABU|nr:hypothetical protein CBR_g23712 [Chara braunii]|eukprot:GBG77381.1 hypothetical protein CBR_g23712 [Chara braunii]
MLLSVAVVVDVATVDVVIIAAADAVTAADVAAIVGDDGAATFVVLVVIAADIADIGIVVVVDVTIVTFVAVYSSFVSFPPAVVIHLQSATFSLISPISCRSSSRLRRLRPFVESAFQAPILSSTPVQSMYSSSRGSGSSSSSHMISYMS